MSKLMLPPGMEAVKKCPNCGKPKTKCPDEQNFQLDDGYICMVSGLSQFTVCDCGIDLDKDTEQLLNIVGGNIHAH